MARGGSYTYNPKTGKWTHNKATSSSNSGSSQKSSASSGGKQSSNTSSSSKGSNLTATNPSKNTSTGSTEKKYNTIEINTLEGNLQFIVTDETIKLNAGDTVKLLGLGKYLSGDYYVKEVDRQIGSNGYEHSAVCIRTDFGDRLKLSTSQESKVTQKPVPSPKKPEKKASRTYTVVRGDCLWNIARKYYGSGTQWKRIYDANQDICGKPYTRGGITYVMIYPGQKLTIP
jgi:LysM repeat protein